jgi:hypothetical protein
MTYLQVRNIIEYSLGEHLAMIKSVLTDTGQESDGFGTVPWNTVRSNSEVRPIELSLYGSIGAIYYDKWLMVA